MNQSLSSPNQNLVSKILQVALGLFVSTTEFPSLPPNHDQLSYDCSFDSPCRWLSVGNNVDRWRIGKGEPDNLLWFAATGTMQIPREPFALIESRGNSVDSLSTDLIYCQIGSAVLTFMYWVIGNTDIEICLTDEHNKKFNCTGKLNSNVMPGKVLLKIPELQNPYKIVIQPSSLPGVVLLDDIRYDVTTCYSTNTKILTVRRGRPDFITTSAPRKIKPWTIKTSSKSDTRAIGVEETSKIAVTEEFTTRSTSGVIEPTTEFPFDLLIFGNKTKPLQNRRLGKVIEDSTKLLCDFNNEFECRWGPESGKWAIIDAGAVPTLEESINDTLLLPTYPAALVLQGKTILTSDPLPCQTGNSKLIFRYWSNGKVLLQVCAVGLGIRSNITHCVERSSGLNTDKNALAVFNINKTINEHFTLNIISQWEVGVKNKFLVIDEIAYIGQCTHQTKGTENLSYFKNSTDVKYGIINTTHSTVETSTTSGKLLSSTYNNFEVQKSKQTKTTLQNKKVLTTFAPIYPEEEDNEETINLPSKLQKKTKKENLRNVTPEPKKEDYCELLNCSFDDNACNYLNHGLTKKPWTLRNRGYGYPLSAATDIRATQANGQFIAAILSTSDIAILESPKFNSTKSLNVLLFQYFRPSQATTIRLCLGSRHTNPMRSVSAFIHCPSILRSVTAKNAYRWNTVHIQLPPGTTHFYLVAHSSEKTDVRAAIAIDNMRVAICDTIGFAPDYIDETDDFQSFLQV